MRRILGPTWTKQQQRAGEKMRRSWETFFSAAEDARERPRQTVANLEGNQDIDAVRARHESTLLGYANVVGVATGIRTKGGSPTGEPCIVVYVERKIPPSELAGEDVLPGELEGTRVDVVEVGSVAPLPA